MNQLSVPMSMFEYTRSTYWDRMSCCARLLVSLRSELVMEPVG